MLDGCSVWWLHDLQNLSLLILSLVFLPLDTLIVLVASLRIRLNGTAIQHCRDGIRNEYNFRERTILVTGVGMTKGLAIARSFHRAGHRVIGADFESSNTLVCGRVSNAISRFYGLRKPNVSEGTAPYLQDLLSVIEGEKVDLWVSCSGVASAVEDGEAKQVIEARTHCKAIQFDAATTKVFHEKHSFMKHVRDHGLTVPETHEVTNIEEAMTALKKSSAQRKFIMKPIGVDDARRGDMTLLPKATWEKTRVHLSNLKISTKMPWILQQYIAGPEYCTHALIVSGQVKLFVACPSAELLMHYEALPMDSSLAQKMLRFTRVVAAEGGSDFTGHLSFDFMTEDAVLPDKSGESRKEDGPTIYPIECNPRAHTAVCLFNDALDMPNAYLSLIDEKKGRSEIVVTPGAATKYYWVGHDIVALVLMPLLEAVLSPGISHLKLLAANMIRFGEHLRFWRDGTFELWDPWPWWWLYHVYWPVQFWNALVSRRSWSRLNVSTTKMFER